MCRAQELGSYAQGQGSLAVFKVTARDQGHYEGFRGHLLHTVTFLVFCFFFALKKLDPQFQIMISCNVWIDLDAFLFEDFICFSLLAR